MKTEISQLKNEMMEIEMNLAELFERRMEIAFEINRLIKEGGLSESNINSERAIISKVTEKQNDEMSSYTRVLFNLSLIHISEPTRLGMISYAVFCLKKKK